MRRLASLGLAALLTLTALPASAGSLRLLENEPTKFDFADLPGLPAEFGRGEFSFEIWVRPDASFPVGATTRGTYDQLRNWSSADPEPYSSDGWWLPGNWLLDGHTRPEGFGPGNSREGTFSLQFYGGGRLRWMFADGKEGMPKGMVYAVQAYPAASVPSLLDGNWHHVVAVRRWRQPEGATLELWVDGTRVGATDIPRRTDMRVYWDRLAHPNDPAQLGGWAIGAEVMTAWNFFFTQYEDYKGGIDDLRLWGRALDPAEIGRLAKGAEPRAAKGLLAHYGFDEGTGGEARDRLGAGPAIRLYKARPESWSAEQRPGSR
jgi:hypothetical protein